MAIDFKVVVHENGTVEYMGRTLSPSDTFDLARQLCSGAYLAQGGPAKDPDERFVQQELRGARKATWFEELYCTIRDIADDVHRETVRRHSGAEPGGFTDDYLDPQKAIDGTGQQVVETIKDWDY